MQKSCSISLNFDSMNEALGFPPGFRDESFFKAADRFFNLLGDNPISIYVIGRDLENPEVAARLRDWSRVGHEIGNHTYTHPQHFGLLDNRSVEDEIERTHDVISNVCHVEPKGFIAPGWSMPKYGYKVLERLGYSYDLSSFNSPWIWAVTAKLMYNEFCAGEYANMLKTVRRPDYLSSLIRKPNVLSINNRQDVSLRILPLPRCGYFDMPIWHTAGFYIGTNRTLEKIEKFYKTNDWMYYTMHPADFFDKSDFSMFELKTHLERMNVSLTKKMSFCRDVINHLRANAKLVTVKSMVGM
jgi:peptidoglycan/xylan/chitin deacetylase (PgdA/CDA1 family)